MIVHLMNSKPASGSRLFMRRAQRGSILAVSLCLCAMLGAALLPSLAHAQLNQLYAFQYDASTISDYPDGENPQAELIQGTDGNYYTTTFSGGSGACFGESQGAIPGCGTVVKITPTGALTVLYSFPYDSSNSTARNGLNPAA